MSCRLYAGWSGQFQHLKRAKAKLKLVVPATLLVIPAIYALVKGWRLGVVPVATLNADPHRA